MSWLFGGGSSGGGNKRDNDDDEEDEEFDSNFDRDDFKGKVVADFDPSALVKGAEAIKTIDQSPNAKEALKIAMLQEKTKQQELRTREQELMAHNLQQRERLMKQEQENALKRNQSEQEQWKERLNEELRKKQQLEQQSIEEKKRAQQEWLQAQKQLNEENLKRQKEVEREIEENRRKTLEYQAQLEQNTAKVKAKAEAEGKIEIEKQNEAIHLRSQKAKLEEERNTKLLIRKAELEAYRDFAQSLRDTLTDQAKLKIIGKAIIGITFGVYVSKYTVSITGKYIEKNLGKPNLVRETSRWSWKDVLPNKKWFTQKNNTNSSGINTNDEIKGIILQPFVENKMKFVCRSTKMTKKNKAPFRHLLIYGPPGTGKTLFARTLARESGLDYAVLTGGDFAQLGQNAVTELHKVFDWAEASRQGTILFIDEADAFLRKGRDKDTMSEDMRNALSAFLYRTGTETQNFMIVLATNVPEALDKAVLDRIDDVVEFPLPGENERKKMLLYYFNYYIKNTDYNNNIINPNVTAIKIEGFDVDINNDPFWDDLAKKTEEFSGRQIAKYLIQVQHTMYGSMDNTTLTPFLMLQILETFLKSKHLGLEK